MSDSKRVRVPAVALANVPTISEKLHPIRITGLFDVLLEPIGGMKKSNLKETGPLMRSFVSDSS